MQVWELYIHEANSCSARYVRQVTYRLGAPSWCIVQYILGFRRIGIIGQRKTLDPQTK